MSLIFIFNMHQTAHHRCAFFVFADPKMKIYFTFPLEYAIIN